MSLWKIAWRSIQQRGLASTLTAVSMALGVALVVAVLVIHGVINQSFRRGAQGYDLIVGPKGSSLELVLSTVYHLSRPAGTIPYRCLKELQQGHFSPDIELAIPVCMGDNYKGFRVIGTGPDMFDSLHYQEDKTYEFAEGRNLDPTKPFEAVIGSVAARKAGLKVGQALRPVHGDTDQGEEHDPFEIVGVLRTTGTPVDRGVFVNLDGFYQMHTREEAEEDEAAEAGSQSQAEKEKAAKEKAAKPSASKTDKHEAGEKHDKGEKHHHDGPLTDDEKKLSAILVVTKPVEMARRVALPRLMSEDLNVLVVSPSEQIARLFETIVGNIQKVLLILAVLIIVVAGIGMMVSIYNSMSDRRHEIAVMRALGARRSTVMMIVLFESILLALGGGALGMLLGHSLTGALSPLIAEHTGVAINPLQFQQTELILIPGLILLATIVGYLPAVMAYRTDVAQSLISTP